MPRSGSSSPMAFQAEGMNAQSPATLISTRGCSSIASRIGFLPTRWRIISSPSRTNWVGHHHRNVSPSSSGDEMPEALAHDEVAPLVLAEAAVNLRDVHAPSLAGRGLPLVPGRMSRWATSTHPRASRVGAPEPPLANGGELRGLPPRCAAAGACACSMSGAGPAPSPWTSRPVSAPGRVVGIDVAEEVLVPAPRRYAWSDGVANAEFSTGDVYQPRVPGLVLRRGSRAPGPPAPDRSGRGAARAEAGAATSTVCSRSETATTERSPGGRPTRFSTGGWRSTTR